MSERMFHVVRDALGELLVFEDSKYNVSKSRETQALTVDRRGADEWLGWYAPGQWVSYFKVTPEELSYLKSEIGD